MKGAGKSSGKSHRKTKAGPKAAKKKTAEQKKKGVLEESKEAKAGNNPRAFGFQSAGKAKAQRARTAEKEQRRLHAPMADRVVEEPPPMVVLVHGPQGVGKSTLIKCLVKHYSQQNLSEVLGPITVVAGKKRRITFVECPSDLNSMIDAAKYADLVLLLIDGSFGFEMETFEFLNLLKVHGFPKVIGVLNHLDGFLDQKRLKTTKKKLKTRFWAEIYEGAKLFYLSGIQYDKYLKREILNLARFISTMKLRPLTWRLAHPYALVDRFEDITPVETLRQKPKCDRDVTLYGYLRGANLKPGTRMHLAGVGDFLIQEMDALPDPCPMPDTIKKRGLNEKERLLYAPMADVGGLLYDKDAVYIDIPDWKVQYTGEGTAEGTEGDAMVKELQAATEAVDEKLERSRVRLFSRGGLVRSDAGVEDAEAEGDSEEEGEEDEGEGDSMDGDEENEDADEGDDDDEEEEEEEEEEESAGRSLMPGGMPKAVEVDAGGRVRRRAVFDAGPVPVQPHSDDEEEEEDAEYEAGAGQQLLGADGGSDDEEGEDEGEDEDDVEGMGGASHWKAGMAARASALFTERAADLFSFVYGRTPYTALNGGGGGKQLDDGAELDGQEGNEDSDEEELFKPVNRKTEAQAVNDLEAVDALDSARSAISSALLSTWEQDEAIESLRNRFVTGNWEEGQRRALATPGADGDQEDEDEEAFGDFEDIETGQVISGAAAAAALGKSGKADPVTAAAQKAIQEATREEMQQKKAAQKAAFNASYDEGGLKGAGTGKKDQDSDEEEGAKKKGKGKPGEEQEETFYDAVKKELTERQTRTRAMLDALDPHTRLAMEGIRPGAYVRLRLTGVPCELVEFLDPHSPLLLGGLGQGEEKMGVMKLRFKRHRWFPKVLKARDPLVFSVGWRRFQSMPVYAVEDHNRRLRNLKYTPEHMHCIASVYGPIAPPNTGVVAVQNLSEAAKGWRISATGVVLELDAQFRVVKKLKLIGTPFKVHRNTAFITGMFTSQLEATKFEGASIRTVSGIRGTIKKAIKTGGIQGAKDGAFRASFEDKILSSDIVFLRAWVAVDIPRFFSPVTNLLSKQLTKPAVRDKARKHRGKRPDQVALPAAAEPAPAAPGAADLAALLAMPMEASGADARAAGAGAGLMSFQASPRFEGARPTFIFKLGPQGLGYYKDLGPHAAVALAKAAAAAKAAEVRGANGAGAAAPAAGVAGGAGWLPMRTVAQLRRDQGVGAPRKTDSLYRPIERAPRKFNPLKIPLALQAALPFKTKPKLEPKRKSKTLEQKRAVVLEPHEKRAYTLVQQLNAIRNEKSKKRNEMNDRRRKERTKKVAKEEEWRAKYNKDERKKRYTVEGQKEALKQRDKEMGSSRVNKKARRE